ncbi:MAG: hypothetical protein H0T73_06465 [Ardenticatenales bacterium]|nr:hypothetical protein [Ardenticatenales bacterium]
MDISPRYTDKDWRALDLTANNEHDWQKGIDIFVDRIQGRFLNIIEAIEQSGDTRVRLFSGFAIMGLDCLLIETLEQFRQGVEKTPKGKGGDHFEKFLTHYFHPDFDTARVKKFYKTIRCGILHQAEILEDSRIRIDYPQIVADSPTKKGLFINRKLFHRKLLEVFEGYVHELREGKNLTLRENFKTKMNYICR